MKPPPTGWTHITPVLSYEDAARAIDWLSEAFAFAVRVRAWGEDGRVAHSELTYGSAVLMVAQAQGEVDTGNAQSLFVYVDDAKAHCERARKAGARIESEPELRTYPDGHADEVYVCVDPGGHRWTFAERRR